MGSKFVSYFKKGGEYNYSVKDVVLSFQHMFAMLGATILVPILTNMSIPMALISAGLGTIAFYLIGQKKVPVFLGSSFAFLPALISIVGNGKVKYSTEWQDAMAVASICIVLAAAVYIILSFVIKKVGVEKVRKLFPPVVIGPVIIIIGMILAPKMFWNNIIFQYDAVIGLGAFGGTTAVAWKQWTAAAVTAITIILTSSLAKPKSFWKVVPVLVGFIVGYIYAAIIGLVSYKNAFSVDRIIIFQNLGKEFSFYKGYANISGAAFLNGFLAIVPIALVTFMEHLGDISANSVICQKDFMVDPGLNRTIMGDGVGTMIAGLLGGPPNTTYGENTAVLAITQNFSTKNILLAAIFAVTFGVFSIFGDFLGTIPSAVIGGASIVLFGMISASGLRALVDGKVDFTNSRNMIIVSVILSIGLGLGAMSLAGDITGNNNLKIMAGSVEISPLALATVVGVVLNLVFPDKAKGEKELASPELVNVTIEEVIIEKDKQTDTIIDEKPEV